MHFWKTVSQTSETICQCLSSAQGPSLAGLASTLQYWQQSLRTTSTGLTQGKQA